MRPLLALAAILVILTGAVALEGNWTPKLGLDLRGGTSLTLQARPVTGGARVTDAAMAQAETIIRARVNGAGVAESTAVRQGSDQIVVQSPSIGQSELRRLVGTTAEVNFRQVLGLAAVEPPAQLTLTPTPGATTSAPTPTPAPKATATPAPKATATPAAPSASVTPAAFREASPGAATPAVGTGRFAVPVALPAATAVPSPAATATAPATPAATAAATTPAPASTAVPSLGPDATVAQVLAATISPTVPAGELARFQAFTCADRKAGAAAPSGQYLITCDIGSTAKYLLGPAFVQGTDVDGASATLPTNGAGGWEVNIDLKGGKATDILRDATTALVKLPQDSGTTPGQPTSNFAIVLDGTVQSAPYVQGAIPGGNAQISGTFTQKEAQQLASIVKFGALPLTFDVQTAQTTSPTLGGEQLRWGLIAGGIGLLLTIGFALLYYRALAVVVAGSLLVAAITSYLLVVFLGNRIGYALSLPGIAGFIVSIGITADSFVVYFERLRDEIRDNRPLRTAVETSWVRARRTIISADFVSLLAAFVLFVLAIQDVRGFAFTLGLTTLVDVLVVFLFTKPLVSLLARTRFFGQGHRFSGLDPEHIGRRLDRPGLRPRGGSGGSRSGGTGAGGDVAGGTGSGGAVPLTPGDRVLVDPADAARARARARAGLSASTPAQEG